DEVVDDDRRLSRLAQRAREVALVARVLQQPADAALAPPRFFGRDRDVFELLLDGGDRVLVVEIGERRGNPGEAAVELVGKVVEALAEHLDVVAERWGGLDAVILAQRLANAGRDVDLLIAEHT